MLLFMLMLLLAFFRLVPLFAGATFCRRYFVPTLLLADGTLCRCYFYADTTFGQHHFGLVLLFAGATFEDGTSCRHYFWPTKLRVDNN
jgi:hypothetical protein